MSPATEDSLSNPFHKRQSDCPILFPVDCGDGNCCGLGATCVNSKGTTKCGLSGGTAAVPAVPGANTPTATTTLSSSTLSSTLGSFGTSSSTSQASPAAQGPQTSLGTAQVAGIAVGSSIGGILLILFIISTLMWYHRRRPPQPQQDDGFNPATDSVGDKPGGPGSPSQVVSMYDPAAWRENYSAASPRELEDRPSMQSLQSPRRVTSEAWLRGGETLTTSPVSTSASHGNISHASSGSTWTWQDGTVVNGGLAPAYVRRTSARASPIAELPA